MSKPIRRHNREYSGGFPLAVGDRYYSQDIFRDQAYQEALTGISYNDLTQQTAPYVITGLVAGQGTGHTMDISAGKAVVPFSVTIPDPAVAWTVPPTTTTANIDMVIDYAGVTGASLAGTTTDGATPNYVKLSYTETNGQTRNRAKKAGTYAYEVYDSVTVVIDAVAPTATEINLLTFTTDGATVTVTDNGDTRIGSPFHMQDAVVYDQTTFNDCIVRVAANQYKIRDDIQSIYCSNLSGGYLMTGGTSPLAGGDSWGYIETNNCNQIIFESEAYIYFADTVGYIEVNTDGCVLKNVTIKGLGTTAVNIVQSFLLNADRVTYDHCQIYDRKSIGGAPNYCGFKGSSTALDNYNANYINCVVSDCEITTSATNGLFHGCFNLTNCHIRNITGSSMIGFRDCNNLTNCTVTEITVTGSIFGFNGCDEVSSCLVYNMDSSGSSIYGFANCFNITACKSYTIDSAADDVYGFYTCINITGCTADQIDHSGSVAGKSAYGFITCVQVSSCFSNDIDTNGAGGTANGFNDCTHLSANKASNCDTGYYDCQGLTSNLADNCTVYGYNLCWAMGFNRATSCGTNYNSCQADWATSQNVADTATGGYNA